MPAFARMWRRLSPAVSGCRASRCGSEIWFWGHPDRPVSGNAVSPRGNSSSRLHFRMVPFRTIFLCTLTRVLIYSGAVGGTTSVDFPLERVCRHALCLCELNKWQTEPQTPLTCSPCPSRQVSPDGTRPAETRDPDHGENTRSALHYTYVFPINQEKKTLCRPSFKLILPCA